MTQGAMRFDNLGLAVRDVSVMHTFYTEVIGMETQPLLPGATAFFARLGNFTLVAFQTANPDPLQGRSIPGFMHNPPGFDHLVFAVDDIDEVGARFEAHGVHFEVDTQLPLPEGGYARVKRFTDPEGNMIGLQQVITDPASIEEE